MNCSEIQQRLSAYHDAELSPDEVERVTKHLAVCSTCAALSTSFRQITRLSKKLDDPPVPESMWSELQAKMRSSTPSTTGVSRSSFQPFAGKFVALAATLLVAVGLWSAYKAWFPTVEQNHHLTMDFASYLNSFSEHPDAAQKILLTKYNGQPTTLREASDVLGYEPVVTKGLPQGYFVKEVHLLEMPCCTCTQVLCSNKSGNLIAIFEHDIDQPVWFGDRQSRKCICHKVPTDVRPVGKHLAATWKQGKRFITIIGATNIDEIADFVAQFKATTSSSG